MRQTLSPPQEEADAAVSTRAVVVHGAGDVRTVQATVGDLVAGEVAVDVEFGAVCGSDVHYFRHGAVGDFRVVEPMVLGHEIVGRVAALHPASGAALPVGTRVVIHPATADLSCDQCEQGHRNRCRHGRYLGSAATVPHTQGGFADRIVVRADQLVAVPAGLPARTAVLAEPLAVGVHAVRRAVAGLGLARDASWSPDLATAAPLTGRRVLVTGAGPIGCLAVAAAVAAGARVGATDLVPRALEVARSCGAEAGVDVSGMDPSTAAATVHHAFGEPDVVIESSGAAAGMGTALRSVRPGGVVRRPRPHAAGWTSRWPRTSS